MLIFFIILNFVVFLQLQITILIFKQLIMKNYFIIALFVLNASLLSATNEEPTIDSYSTIDSICQWENVKVLYSSNEAQNMEKGDLITNSIDTSLNFATKERIKNDCLIELQKKAAKLGYSAILIDKENSFEKRYNKRGLKVTLVAIGYSL